MSVHLLSLYLWSYISMAEQIPSTCSSISTPFRNIQHGITNKSDFATVQEWGAGSEFPFIFHFHISLVNPCDPWWGSIQAPPKEELPGVKGEA